MQIEQSHGQPVDIADDGVDMGRELLDVHSVFQHDVFGFATRFGAPVADGGELHGHGDGEDGLVVGEEGAVFHGEFDCLYCLC